MTEAKKARTRSPKTAPKADLIELAAAPVVEAVEMSAAAESTPRAEASTTKAPQTAPVLPSMHIQGDALRQAMREAMSVSAQGALEVNGKIIEALNAQSHAALDLWRTALGSPTPLPEKLNAQTSAAREAFETASAQWKEIAEATSRWMTKTFEPLQSAMHRQAR